MAEQGLLLQSSGLGLGSVGGVGWSGNRAVHLEGGDA